MLDIEAGRSDGGLRCSSAHGTDTPCGRAGLRCNSRAERIGIRGDTRDDATAQADRPAFCS
jgi:hypothetical protein